MNRSTMIASVLLLTGLLAACSSSGSTRIGTSPTTPATTAASSATTASASSAAASGSAPATSATAASAAMITIKNFSFTVTGAVTPGAKIMVHNGDSEAHTVTADTGKAFDVMVPASATVTLTAPSKPGTYKFHCNYHSNMHGSLTVG